MQNSLKRLTHILNSARRSNCCPLTEFAAVSNAIPTQLKQRQR